MGFSDLLAVADAAVILHCGDQLNVTYTPSVGSPVVVEGVFDNYYQKLVAGTPGVVEIHPAFFCRRASLPVGHESDSGATLTIEGITYRIIEPQVDRTGGALLILHRITTTGPLLDP